MHDCVLSICFIKEMMMMMMMTIVVAPPLVSVKVM